MHRRVRSFRVIFARAGRGARTVRHAYCCSPRDWARATCGRPTPWWRPWVAGAGRRRPQARLLVTHEPGGRRLDPADLPAARATPPGSLRARASARRAHLAQDHRERSRATRRSARIDRVILENRAVGDWMVGALGPYPSDLLLYPTACAALQATPATRTWRCRGSRSASGSGRGSNDAWSSTSSPSSPMSPSRRRWCRQRWCHP